MYQRIAVSEGDAVSGILGIWDVTIDGLKGTRTDTYTFTDQDGKIVCEVASTAAQDIAPSVTVHGNEIQIEIQELAPIPAWFTLRAEVRGDEFAGESKSKYLPPQPVHAVRRS